MRTGRKNDLAGTKIKMRGVCWSMSNRIRFGNYRKVKILFGIYIMGLRFQKKLLPDNGQEYK